jgi:CRISPR/Cas system-associated exonuclease Cas4 (RecB family)
VKPTIRSSALPMFMACNPAVLNPDRLASIETENETSLLGNLVHDVCENLVATGEITLAPLKQRLSEADFDRASVLTSNFLAVWREAKKVMLNPVLEAAFSVDLGGAIITGHIDNYHLDPLRAFILDYKTGRQHEDHYHQMAAYAFGVWDTAGRPENFTIYVTVVYLEDNTVKPYEFTPSLLLAWAEEINEQVKNSRYTVGRKCAFCTLQDTCPAWSVYGRNARQMLLAADKQLPAWDNLTPEDRGDIVDALYVLDKAKDRVRLNLRNNVQSKGPMDLGHGKEYVLLEQEEKQLNLAKALPILEKRIGKGNVSSLSKMPLDSALAAYAGKAAKGKKTVARNELFAELDAAGAIVRVATTKLWRRPKNETQMEVTK